MTAALPPYNAAVTQAIPGQNGWDFSESRIPDSGGLEVFPLQSACYALFGSDGRRVHLGTTSRLRQALLKIQGSERSLQSAGFSQVRWRPVYSRFEADAAWLELLAADPDPAGRKTAMRQWSSCWLVLEEEDRWPRWQVRQGLGGDLSRSFGPFAARPQARAMLEEIEDFFDLCREQALLVQAPHAIPCAYKAMGRCSAACDGSVSREHYLGQVRQALEYLAGDVSAAQGVLEDRMRRAAQALRYEDAALLWKRAQALRQADHPPGRAIRPAPQWQWLSLQRDRSRKKVRVFVAGAGGIVPAGDLAIGASVVEVATMLEAARRVAGRPDAPAPAPEWAGCRIALASWHAGRTGRGGGVMLDLQDADEDQVREALGRFAALPVAEESAPTGEAIALADEIEER